MKQMALQVEGNQALSSRLAISGALRLYLDFLNLFIMLVQIMGDRRRN